MCRQASLCTHLMKNCHSSSVNYGRESGGLSTPSLSVELVVLFAEVDMAEELLESAPGCDTTFEPVANI